MRKRLLDCAVWLAIFLCGCLLVAMLAYPAYAQEVTTGTGIICDTADQLKQYASLSKEEGAIEKINAEAGTSACGIAPVAFVIGPKHGQVRTKDGPFEITEIMVIAFQSPFGWQRVPPMVQFTLFKVKEEES